MIFSKNKPKNCRGCEHKDVCDGVKRRCVYRIPELENRLKDDYPCKDCCYGRCGRICFPCYRNLQGQPGIKEWMAKHPKLNLG